MVQSSEMKRRTLYLPVEIKPRELLGKTLLAARAVERGWRVFIGGIEMHDYMGDAFPPGLLIENNIRDTKADRLHRTRNRGGRVADLCEESALYQHGDEYWGRKIGSRSLAATDLILAVGARSERDVRSCWPEAADKLVLTGNPRFDILSRRLRCVHDDEARAIRERYGRFLLVNSNFGPVNPFKTGIDVVAVLQRDGKLSTPEQVARQRRYIAYKTRHLQQMQSLLSIVAEAGVFESIVVRPHPAENHDAWRRWGAALKIDVRYEGSAAPWMLAADMILHPGCTTAVEALLLDRPAVSFVPEPDSEFLNQADVISAKVACAAELLALVPGWGRSDGEWRRTYLADGRSALRTYIDSAGAPRAADRILDAAEGLDLPETGPVLSAFRRVRGAMNPARRTSWREALRRTRSELRLQKFPGLCPKDVRAPVARWIEAGVLRRMPDVMRVGGSLLRLQ